MRCKIIEWSQRVREQHSKDETRCKTEVKKEILQQLMKPRTQDKYENVHDAVLGLEKQVNDLSNGLQKLPALMGQVLQRRRAMRAKEPEGHNGSAGHMAASNDCKAAVPEGLISEQAAEPDKGKEDEPEIVPPTPSSAAAHPAQDEQSIESSPEIDCLSDKPYAAMSSDQPHSATASGLQSTAASDAPSQSDGKKPENETERKSPPRKSLSKKAAQRNTSNSIVSGLQPKALAESLAQLFSLQQNGSKDIEWQMKPVKEAAKKLVAEKVKPCAASFFFHQADVDKNGMLDRAQLATALQRLPGFGTECIPLFEVKLAELYSEGDGQLDIDEWIDLCEEIPELLNAVTSLLDSQGWRRLLGCEDSMMMPGEVAEPQEEEAGDGNSAESLE